MNLEQFKHKMKQIKPPGPVFGWICTYTPEEVLHAAGFTPVGIRRSSGNEAEDVYLGRNMCSYVHSIFGGALSGKYSGMKGIVMAHGCECLRRLYDGWGEWNSMVTPRFAYQLNVPVTCSALSIDYFADNLRSFIKALEENFSVSISDEKLLASIKVYDKTRSLLARLSSLRERDNPPVSGQQATEILDICMNCDRESFNTEFEPVLEELEKSSSGIFSAGRSRIMILGGIYNPDIARCIEKEETGGIVVCEDTCSGLRYHALPPAQETGVDPVLELSRRYLSKSPCPRMSGGIEQMIESDLLELIKKYRVDGVIYYITKYCENHYWEYPFIREILEKNKTPLKRIEGEIAGDIPEREIRSFIELINL
jgi:benzoyl-CoA reductase/2-hydroxyglutaryl-CoA dehydratase subunit BcrC/BadD/HgdB